MEGKRPKRRKDKYNPYTIYERNGHHFVLFEDGQGVSHILEINKYCMKRLIRLNWMIWYNLTCWTGILSSRRYGNPP